MSRIALYGGAFDPPHWGHVSVVSQVINEGACDEVWVVPSGDRKDKSYFTEATDRRRMVEILFETIWRGEHRVSPVWDQLEGGLSSYSIDLFRWAQRGYPHHEFYLVIGEELLDDVIHWHNGQTLIAEAQFLVLSRPTVKSGESDRVSRESTMESKADFALGALRGQRVRNPHNIQLTTSSTEIRAMVRKGYTLAGLVPYEVELYMYDRQLYGS